MARHHNVDHRRHPGGDRRRRDHDDRPSRLPVERAGQGTGGGLSVDPHFEGRRQPIDDPDWVEAHLVLAITPKASILILASIHPRRAEQVAVVWPAGGVPVVMSEPDIPIPALRWEFRTDGLWAEQVCEAPHDHWSYGLEAFALEVDDPTELTRTGFGRRVPLGWELDFDAVGPSRWLLTDAAPLPFGGAYTQRGTLHGLLLGADGETATEGPAQRWHWWGTKPLASAGIATGGLGEPAELLHVPLARGTASIRRSPATLSMEVLDALAPAPETR
jgi:hypothetical protein